MIKSYELTLKDVDTKQGIVEGYFSVFHNIDSDGDIMLPGAFTKSISENGPQSQKKRIKHLKNHDPSQHLASIKELKEDTHGLFFRSKLPQTTLGKDTLIEYDEGMLTDHSVGIQIIQSDRNEETGIRNLKEVRMWEGSSVLWGANDLAQVTSVKGSIKEQFDYLSKRMALMDKILHKGEMSDGAYIQIEQSLNEIKAYLGTLEPLLNTQAVESRELIDFVKNKLIS